MSAAEPDPAAKRIRAPEVDHIPETDKSEIMLPILSVTLDHAPRSHILQTLQQTGGVIDGRHGAATWLGLPRTTLIAKMRRMGMI
jgi:transcriptional regulator with GAF, ATPase, and Fis domain